MVAVEHDTLNSITIPAISRLVEQAQQGSPEAVGALYDRYQERIFRYIWSRVLDYQLAEDLTGEVFVRMITQLPGFKATGAPFEAWLYRIARNLVIDYLRKAGRYHAVDLSTVEELVISEGNPSMIVETTLTIERADGAMRALDPLQAEVIRLRFLVGLSLNETAATLEKTISAVKALQHRGLTILRRLLENEDE